MQAESAHAHPAPPPTPRTPQERCEIHLKGLQGTNRTSGTDIYVPDVRRSSFDNDVPINHREMVSCWKGLNIHQAEEIFTWERIFCEALKAQVSGAQTVTQWLSTSDQYFTDNVHELVRKLPATDGATFKLVHDVDISLQNLLHIMVARYFECKSSLPCYSD